MKQVQGATYVCRDDPSDEYTQLVQYSTHHTLYTLYTDTHNTDQIIDVMFTH